MGPYTLLCSDLDGTLLDDARRISPYSREIIARARREGAVFCLTSGRPPAMMGAYQNFLGLDGPLVANNGAIVRHPSTGQILLHCPLPLEPGAGFLDFCRQQGLDWAIFDADSVYLEESPARAARYEEYNALAAELGAEPVKVCRIAGREAAMRALEGGGLRVSVLFHEPRQAQLLEDYFAREGGLQLIHSTPESFDVLAPGVDKWQGILAVCRYYGISPQHVCVFGNDLNDVEMIRRAPGAFVVSNAEKPLLALGRQQIQSNQEDGVAKAIARYVLGNILPLSDLRV